MHALGAGNGKLAGGAVLSVALHQMHARRLPAPVACHPTPSRRADTLTHAPRAGNSKLVVQSAEVRDATGSLEAAPGAEAGAVLTLWNPDESWARDALLRVNAVLGPATRAPTGYEHIEVVVHPLGVHLNEAVAAAFWVRAPAALSRTPALLKRVPPCPSSFCSSCPPLLASGDSGAQGQAPSNVRMHACIASAAAAGRGRIWKGVAWSCGQRLPAHRCHTSESKHSSCCAAGVLLPQEGRRG